MQTEQMRQEILTALNDAKGVDIRVIDVRGVTDFTDEMILVSGTSSRHVQTLADKVRSHLRSLGVRAVGSEGEAVGDWVLIDFGDVVVHVMRPQVRDFYNLEKLWGDGVRADQASSGRRS
jgi:ribosome silencing factor RsfS/YbeB/iojap